MCARLKRDRYRRMSSPSFRRSPIWCHSGRMKSRLACRSAGHIRGRAKRAGRLTISATDSKPADGVFVPTDEDPAEHEHVHRLKNKRKTGMLVWRSRRRYSRLVQGSLESLNVPIIGYPLRAVDNIRETVATPHRRWKRAPVLKGRAASRMGYGV